MAIYQAICNVVNDFYKDNGNTHYLVSEYLIPLLCQLFFVVMMKIIVSVLNADLSAGPRRAALMNKMYFMVGWWRKPVASKWWKEVYGYGLDVVNEHILQTDTMPTKFEYIFRVAKIPSDIVMSLIYLRKIKIAPY